MQDFIHTAEPVIDTAHQSSVSAPQFDFGKYVCVFVGDPRVCTPYACFASKGQADNWNEEIGLKHPMMTIDEWKAQYAKQKEAEESAECSLLLLSVNGTPVGWTADEKWAIEWMFQLKGRGYRGIKEIVPAPNE